ncbi:MAG: hypothetical protein WC004_01685 [Candidatus Absconditabacterales bacterium]
MERVVQLVDELKRVKEEVGSSFEKDDRAQHIAWTLLCEAKENGGPTLKPRADGFIAEKVNSPVVILDRMTTLISGRN